MSSPRSSHTTSLPPLLYGITASYVSSEATVVNLPDALFTGTCMKDVIIAIQVHGHREHNEECNELGTSVQNVQVYQEQEQVWK